jgi:hypothetical protein
MINFCKKDISRKIKSLHMLEMRVSTRAGKGQDTRITTNGCTFMINSFGWITLNNKIHYVKTYSHATVFFISYEIE